MAISGFGPMYFQYAGLADLAAGSVTGMIIAGAGLGSFLGGVVGDNMARWSPRHGRILTAQVSTLMGVPFVIMIFLIVPRYPQYQYLLGCLCFFFGLLASWCPTGCNRPIMVDIAGHNSVASVMAWSACLERGIGSLVGPMAVGTLVSVAFGYKTSELQVASMSEVNRLQNCDALGKSIVICAILPWTLALLTYGFLHRTYSEDVRLKMARVARIAVNHNAANYGSTPRWWQPRQHEAGHFACLHCFAYNSPNRWFCSANCCSTP